jgi:plastocyanin
VRRAAAAVCALALAALLVAPALGAAGRDAASTSSGCDWKRHTKRVVRHVRRHGKVRRVVRFRHWWSCRRSPTPGQVAGGDPTAPGSPQQPTEEGPTAAHLGVKASEYKFVLSRPSVSAGELVVELDNQGEDPHNLNLQLADGQGPELHVGEIGSQKRVSARFTLPAGTYRLFCSLPGHEELGMKATLTVAP